MMHPTTRKLLAASSFLLAAAPLASAQGETGFLRGAGRTDVVIGYTLDYYDEFWVGTDKVEDPGVGEIERTSYTLYAAYGLNDETDLFLSAAYVEAESDGTGGFDDESDLQDAVVGAKWRFYRNRMGAGELSLLAVPSVKFPMTDYENNNVTAIGDEQTDIRARAVAHYQHDSGIYLAVETGYDFRFEDVEDEIPLNVTLGATVFERLTISPFYSQVWSDGGPDIGDPGFKFNEVQEEYERAGVSAYFRISEQLGATFLWRTTMDGRNTGDADAFGFGLVGSF